MTSPSPTHVAGLCAGNQGCDSWYQSLSNPQKFYYTIPTPNHPQIQFTAMNPSSSTGSTTVTVIWRATLWYPPSIRCWTGVVQLACCALQRMPMANDLSSQRSTLSWRCRSSVTNPSMTPVTTTSTPTSLTVRYSTSTPSTLAMAWCSTPTLRL
jgi:hypothetical protein